MKNLTSKLIEILFSILPYNDYGDFIFDYINFVRNHKRIPGSKKLISDFLFKLKRSTEIIKAERNFTTDKQFVKLFITSIIGESHNVKTLAILKSEFDIMNYNFPKRCCIKPTHTSQNVILRRVGEDLPLKEINSWLKIDHYKICRERNYKNLVPKIIVEPIVFDDENLNDYKFFCFNGSVKFIQVDVNRRSNHRRQFFNREWSLLNFSITYPIFDGKIVKPKCFDDMIIACEKLASHFSFVRIDFYTNGQEFLVGEITHCPGSACESFVPREKERLASEILFGR